MVPGVFLDTNICLKIVKKMTSANAVGGADCGPAGNGGASRPGFGSHCSSPMKERVGLRAPGRLLAPWQVSVGPTNEVRPVSNTAEVELHKYQDLAAKQARLFTKPKPLGDRVQTK